MSYTPLIVGNESIAEDLLDLGKMILCVESETPCENCKDQIDEYKDRFVPEILELSKLWANYAESHKGIVLKSIIENYDLNKISEVLGQVAC